MFHQNIRLPGIYIFNSNNADNYSLQSAPIYCTMDDNMNLMALGMDNADEQVLVFPKYKIILYPGAIDSSPSITIDNTNGTKCIFTAGLNTATTCRVYYNNEEIQNCFSTTGY